MCANLEKNKINVSELIVHVTPLKTNTELVWSGEGEGEKVGNAIYIYIHTVWTSFARQPNLKSVFLTGIPPMERKFFRCYNQVVTCQLVIILSTF